MRNGAAIAQACWLKNYILPDFVLHSDKWRVSSHVKAACTSWSIGGDYVSGHLTSITE